MRHGSPRRGGVFVRLLALTGVLTAVSTAVLTGCAGGSGTRTGPSPSPSPRTTSPQELCEQLISHWAGVVLGGGKQSHLDYQQMGLSGGQNEILLAVVAAARAEEKANGPAGAQALIDRQARTRCAERYRGGTPTGGPWQ